MWREGLWEGPGMGDGVGRLGLSPDFRRVRNKI